MLNWGSTEGSMGHICVVIRAAGVLTKGCTLSPTFSFNWTIQQPTFPYTHRDKHGHVASARPSSFSLLTVLSCITRTFVWPLVCWPAVGWAWQWTILRCIQKQSHLVRQPHTIFEIPNYFKLTDFTNRYCILCAGCMCACKGLRIGHACFEIYSQLQILA